MSDLPPLIRPMLATAGLLPAESDDGGWCYEMKWDGVRAMVYVEHGRLRALSRNDLDITPGYPELETIVEAFGGRSAIVDGEVVAFDASGVPSFEALQSRMHVRAPAQVRQLAAVTPVVFLPFDVVHVDGRSTTSLSYDERRALLTSLNLSSASCVVPPSFEGGGVHALATSKAQRLEGVVAKKRTSSYDPGARSSCWVKIKHVMTQEVVIVGWKPGSGSRSGRIGALLLAVPEAGEFVYIGNVGTGFTQAALSQMQADLAPLMRSSSALRELPDRRFAAAATWVEPVLVGEVVFSGWTRDRKLRHPTWRGLRPDKDPLDVAVESLR